MEGQLQMKNSQLEDLENELKIKTIELDASQLHVQKLQIEN